MPALTAVLRGRDALRRLALASLIANIGIVVTGGAVRLTGSGLGCPTWPRCSGDSYTTTEALGVHGVIEFGNRLLTFALGILAALVVLSVLARRERRRPVVTGSVVVLVGIPAQAVVGGVTVLTELNPWVVACHFLVSMAVIAAAYVTWRASGDRPAPVVAAAPIRQLGRLIVVVSAVTLAVGVVVTASGPHAGDADARRTGIDPQTISQLHADVVFFLLGLSIATWFGLRAAGAATSAVRASTALIAVALAQGAIGVTQYLTDLPVLLVGLHLLGACLFWIAALALGHETGGWLGRGRQTGGPDLRPGRENDVDTSVMDSCDLTVTRATAG